jgi:hypothetical protein
MRVGVFPERELRLRTRLFGALAQAYPVRFDAIETPDAPGCDAVIAFGTEIADRTDLPQSFVIAPPSGAAAAPRDVRFGDSAALDARLRGRALSDGTVTDSALVARSGDEILASVDRDPLWLKRHVRGCSIDTVACGPPDLQDGEVLRDHIDPGRFVRLLPLIHFLREVCAPALWHAPPPRAVFVVDDPNLHRPSYGYLKYPELIEDARACRYHVAMAMVPLDAWYAHRATVRLFRESSDVVSLCVHGNDHVKHELGTPSSLEAARRIVAQSLRRVEAFEKRTGLPIARVMAPPHEACSAESMQAMLEVGFEAATLTRPYPWMPFGPAYSHYAAPDGQLLAGWEPAELVCDGFPVLVRRQFEEHDEIVLRGFLDQPVILYGHVSDFEGGLESLRSAASVINSLPAVEWGSIGELAARNYRWRREGDVLELLPFARRLRVEVSPDVAEIRIEPSSGEVDVTLDGARAPSLVVEDGRLQLGRDRSGPAVVELRWRASAEPLQNAHRTTPSPRALARRLLVEARDRVAPFV